MIIPEETASVNSPLKGFLTFKEYTKITVLLYALHSVFSLSKITCQKGYVSYTKYGRATHVDLDQGKPIW